MVARQHQAHGRGKERRQSLRSVDNRSYRLSVLTVVGRSSVSESVCRQSILSPTRTRSAPRRMSSNEACLLQIREIPVEQSAFFLCTYQFFFCHADNPYLLGIVDDTLELVYCFHELHHLIFVGNFLGQQVSTAERREINSAVPYAACSSW